MARASTGTAGERLGKYELLRRIAVGGMGEVFLARETGLAGFRRLVVVKRLIPELAEQPDLVELFIDEARIAGYLSHPNIVQIHELGQEDGTYFLAMEYVPGQDVSRLFRRASQGQVAIRREIAVHIVAEMCRALAFAHNARDADGRPLSIVHRDVSPHNVLVSTGGDVKLMDFGIAKAANKLHRTRTGVIRGKFAYMAPEQIDGGEVDARTDVFAAGVMLWELTLSRRLFDGRNEVEILQKVQRGRIPEPRSVEPDYPEELEAIALAALRRDPGARLASAGELAANLRELLASWARVDRDELGALVGTLFPEIEEGVREADASQIATAPRGETRTAAPGIVLQTPAASAGSGEDGAAPAASAGSGEDGAAAAGAAGSTRPTRDLGSRPARPRSRRAALLAGLVVLATGAALGGTWLSGQAARTDRDAVPDLAEAGEPVGSVALASPADAGPVAVAVFADAGAADTDASVRAEVSPAVAEVKPAERRRRPPRRAHDASPASSAPQPRPVAEAPASDGPPGPPPRAEQPAAIAPGTLVVGSSPWGALHIDGQSHGKTDLQVSLAPGTYGLTLEVSEGGGVFRARAAIESGRRTRCRQAAGTFTCERPR